MNNLERRLAKQTVANGYGKSEKAYTAKRVKSLKRAIKIIATGMYSKTEDSYFDGLSAFAVAISAKKDKCRFVGKNERAWIMDAKDVLNDIVEMMATGTPYKMH